MTIKTLKYIHKLLKDEEWKTRQVYKSARDLQYEYEENNADKDQIKRQEEVADHFMNEHSAANNALEDFENQEW